MAICVNCGKHPNRIAWSRHQKGSSGASGTWALKAQITKRTQKPNLHTFKSKSYCTKCLRLVKAVFTSTKSTLRPVV